MRILICGFGSMGKKHLENLKLLGETADIIDPIHPAKYKDSYELGLVVPYDLVIISSPSETHDELLHFYNDRKVPYIMIEKPLWYSVEGNRTGCETMIEGNLPQYVNNKEQVSQVFVNYPYKFERGLKKLKECLPMVGKMNYASLENGYAYEKMHNYPFETYEGILYDDCHIINISRWLFGNPKKILWKYYSKNLSIFGWEIKGARILHTTNCLNQRYKKRIEVSGEEGNLIWNFKSHEIFFCPKDESERRAISYKHTDHLFESLKYVVGVVREGGEFGINDIFDAAEDVEIIKELMS